MFLVVSINVNNFNIIPKVVIITIGVAKEEDKEIELCQETEIIMNFKVIINKIITLLIVK